MKLQKQAFTLVELIVVITILAILGTIAFISLQWYSKSSRDSVRISDISKIKSSLDLFHIDAWKYPEVTNWEVVTYSGWEVWTQWTFWDITFKSVDKLNKIPTDPLTWKEYIYSRLNTKNEYEIWSIMESDLVWLNIINEANAADPVKSYVTWTYNWILAKVSTGSITYILSVPTLISSNIWDGNLTWIISRKALAYNWYDNVGEWLGNYTSTWGFDFSSTTPENIVVFEWNISDLSISSNLKIFTENLQTAYSWTSIWNIWIYSEILSINLSNDNEILSLAWVIVDNYLWWKVVDNYLTNGICWWDNWLNLMASPINLCDSWTATPVQDGWIWFTYSWSCAWNDLWATTSCSANHIDNPFTFDPVTWTITDYNPAIWWTDVVIPWTIDWVTVTSIWSSAFKSKGLTSVTIPSSITIIWASAFDHNSLTSITLSNSLISIWDYAFGYNNLSSIIIPNSVTSIWQAAFRYNVLTSVTISNNVTSLWGYAFNYQTWWAWTVYGPASWYIYDTYLNNTGGQFDKTDLKWYRWTCTVDTCIDWAFMVDETVWMIVDYDPVIWWTNVVIPWTIDWVAITSIWNFAFKSKGLTSVIIPSSIISIWTSAFYGNSLTSVTIPSSITIIWASVFQYNSLTSAIIPSSITIIWASAFDHNSLTSITLSNSLISIWDYAFGYNNLSSIIIPNSVTSIWQAAFRYNVLTSVTISNNVTSLWGYAFNYQTWWAWTVYGPASWYIYDTYLNNTGGQFDKTDLKWYRWTCTVDTCIDWAFMVDETVWIIVDYDPVIWWTDVVIPSTIDWVAVTSIWDYAFKSKGLTSVTIPSSVTSIWSFAFQINSLTSVIIPSSITSIWDYIFEHNSLTSITIPNSVTSIWYAAFGNNSLTSVIIPNSVTILWPAPFRYNNLTSVTIPSSVTSIWSFAFGGQGWWAWTVYGPASWYVFDTYSNNTGGEFDKIDLATYVGNQP
jgi:prepilin-type N-terminal cleavage/methylation domain-containing protein